MRELRKFSYADKNLSFIFTYLDSLYAVGGKDLSSAERYDPVQDKWDEIASMASVRERHQLVAIDGSIYAIGKRRKFLN